MSSIYASASTSFMEGRSVCVNSVSETEMVKYLIVWDKTGGCVAFALDERPRLITDINKSEVVCLTTKQEITFSLKDVHKYTLDADNHEDTAVEDVNDEKGGFKSCQGSLEFYGFNPNMRVDVYGIDGMLKEKHRIADDGCMSMDTSGWAGGIYLIKIGNTTYKIIKK